MTPDTDDAPALVPLRELTDLARLGLAMCRAQQAYFAKRKATPHVDAKGELRAAQLAEKRFESACKDALNRERASLPGMGDG